MSKSEGQGPFWGIKVSEMSELVSLRLGVKFVTSLNTGENYLRHSLY